MADQIMWGTHLLRPIWRHFKAKALASRRDRPARHELWSGEISQHRRREAIRGVGHDRDAEDRASEKPA
jgi:hypothetical protein